MKLTQAFVKRVTCKAGVKKQEFYDDDLKGFILEVRNNGRKTFFLRLKGAQTKKTSYTKIADASILPLEVAKGKALKLKRNIEEDKDVILDTKKQHPKAITLGEFYTKHYQPYVEKHVKSYKANCSTFTNHILPTFKDIPMNTIKKLQIMKIHEEMVHKKRLKPATANKFLIFFSHAYHLAHELALEDIEENPVQGIKLFKENNARERFLTQKEVKRLIKAVNSSENEHLKYIIPLLILSGARRSEVLHARWMDFNETQMIWTIPITKNGKRRVLPLTTKLYDLYKSIPKKSNTYLFPSPNTGKVIN